MTDHNQERTEQATPKRQQEAAEKGQIARSRELTTLGILLGSAASLLLLGPSIVASLAEQMRLGLRQDRREIFDSNAIASNIAQAMIDFLELLLPFLGIMLILALLAPLALGGWQLSGQALGFKLERVNPVKGLRRLFSWRALMELLKALAKFLFIGAVATMLLWLKAPELLLLGSEALVPALGHTAQLLGWLFLLLALPMLLIAGIDVPFQLYDHARQLRMTKQEVKDELKNTEGKPEVKGRIRQLQHEIAQRRMMAKVPEADIVITNPSHFAVALQYREKSMAAPTIIAKGTDLIASTVRAIAMSHHIPIVEAPLLARALYFNCELDKPIPISLYMAVAKVLAYIYELRQEGMLTNRPLAMPDIEIPAELKTEQ